MSPSIPEQFDDEISIYGFWQVLREGWRWLVGGVALAGVVAGAWLAVASPQYEATGLLQIGQLAQPGQVGQIGQIGRVPVESSVRVIERMMFPSFQDQVLKQLGWGGQNDSRGYLFRHSLKVTLARNTDFVEMKVRGLTRDDAVLVLLATVDHLAATHREQLQPELDSLSADLAATEREAADVVKDFVRLNPVARLQAELPPRDRFSETLLYQQLSLTKAQRLQELDRRAMQLRSWIALMQRQGTTGLVDLPWLPEQPVFPKRGQTLALAVLGGGFAGLLIAFLRYSWRRPMAENGARC